MLAMYNRWAARRILTSAAGLDTPQALAKLQALNPAKDASARSAAVGHVAPVGLPCNSVFGTLAHLYFADMLIMNRVAGRENPAWLNELWNGADNATAWERCFAEKVIGAAWDPSDEALAGRALLEVRMAVDDQSGQHVDEVKAIPEPAFHELVAYKTTDGSPARRSRAALLSHWVNHGTHHRGQISGVIAAAGQPYPVLDQSAWWPEWEEIHAKAFKWA